jgi:integrase/recombinase XerD
LKDSIEKLGWTKHVTAHILRHSFASTLVRNNASLPAVQSILGHSDLRVTSRYIHQNLEQLRDAVNLI